MRDQRDGLRTASACNCDAPYVPATRDASGRRESKQIGSRHRRRDWRGDVITTWGGKSINHVRDVMHLLGPESVGTTVDLGLVRGGATATLQVILGERPIR
jgi:S1-C subfamily serine protease